MRSNGLFGVHRRKGTWTTQRAQDARPAPDLVQRQFEADAPNRLWAADITYIPTWSGFLYSLRSPLPRSRSASLDGVRR